MVDSRSGPDGRPNEAMWRGILDGTDPQYARSRAWLKHLPGSPRCRMCAAPFGTPGRYLMRFMDREPWDKNPEYCQMCFTTLSSYRGGAEIGSSFLFADVRGSTTMAEKISPNEFRQLLDRFYDVAARVLVQYDGIVDKFVGDEVVGIFIPALSGDRHAAQAVGAARAMLEATGHGGATEPWVPIGIGVTTGVAYVGSVGEPPVTAFTGLGDIVNTAARLASVAAAGEILLTQATAVASAIDIRGAERRELALKGKTETTDVVVLTAA